MRIVDPHTSDYNILFSVDFPKHWISQVKCRPLTKIGKNNFVTTVAAHSWESYYMSLRPSYLQNYLKF